MWHFIPVLFLFRLHLNSQIMIPYRVSYISDSNPYFVSFLGPEIFLVILTIFIRVIVKFTGNVSLQKWILINSNLILMNRIWKLIIFIKTTGNLFQNFLYWGVSFTSTIYIQTILLNMLSEYQLLVNYNIIEVRTICYCSRYLKMKWNSHKNNAVRKLVCVQKYINLCFREYASIR